MASNKADLIQGAIAVAIFGGGLIYRSVKNFRRMRKVADTPRSKIASAPQGFVELEGFAWPCGETVQTIDGQEAVYYSLKVEEERRSGKNSRSWVTIYSFEHSVPFFLLDPTGLAVVIPNQHEAELSNGNTTYFRKLNRNQQKRLGEMVRGTVSGFPTSSSLFSKNYRITEKKLVGGSPTYASGSFRTEVTNKITIDDSLATFANRVIDFGSRSLRNVSQLLDTDKDGKVSAGEALNGYITAAKLSRLNPKKDPAPIEVFGVLSSCDNHTLFFADKHENHLVESLGRWRKLKVVSGAALVTSAICAILLNLNIMVNPFEPRKANALEQQSQQIEQQRKRQQAEYDIKVMHEACASGQGGFCRQLIERKNELQLTEQHLKYYSMMGCRGGEVELCETSRDLSSSGQ